MVRSASLDGRPSVPHSSKHIETSGMPSRLKIGDFDLYFFFAYFILPMLEVSNLRQVSIIWLEAMMPIYG